MTSSMLRRQLKNLVQNYSEAEVKVREATSNDPWGPSSSQMADISDLTYNVVACNEIMTMLWKRLKDDRNWRHIHKSLTLLEYLLKTGDERVLLKMKDNIYIVKALTEYRFVEKDGKDQGVNVREKAKVVLVLMEDDDKLKEERDFAFKTREKTSKSSAASSADTIKDPNYKPCYVPGATGLPTLTNIPSVADLAADFAARKEERLRQEAEKKEAERRAKMSEDELKWEDAGKGSGVKVDAWGGQKSEEEDVKPGPWGAAKEPKEAEGPWGTPDRPETSDTEMTETTDAWGAPVKSKEEPFAKADEDPFAAPKNGEDPFVEAEDPFSAPKDDPFTAKDSTDPFSAPKDKQSPEGKPDPFTASEDDPFTSKKDAPFNTPKDDPFSTPKNDPFTSEKEDPFNTPKDDPFKTKTEDPFTASKDDPFTSAKDDPFNTPKDDPFNTPKDDPFTAKTDDPFGAPKDDPFTSTKDDPFNTPKDDPFKTQAEDPFGAPKNDPFTSKQDDPFTTPKDDPFSTSKDDPFTSAKEAPTSPPPKEDPFAAPSKPTDDPFGAPTSPPKEDPFSAPSSTEDPFAAPTTPPKEDPFSAPSKPSEDPFGAPTSPPKEDPFAAPASPPKDTALDPFSAPSASSPQDRTDAWSEPASPPPATAADAWGAASPSQETKAGDPWADGVSAMSPVDNSDPFGDASKPDNDPWGAPASAPVNTDDAWGSPAPPTATSPSDPFGSKADPWGAPGSTPNDGTGKRSTKDKEMYKKTASFLGSAGASLVDLDDLFSSNPKPKQGSPVVASAVAGQTRATGALNAPLPVSYPQQATALPGGHFGSTPAHSYSPFGAARQPTEPSLFQSQIVVDVSHFGCNMGQLASGSGPVQTQAFAVGPQTVFGAQMTTPGPLFGDFSALAGLQQTGAAPPTGSGVSSQLFPNSSETNNNYNPFLI